MFSKTSLHMHRIKIIVVLLKITFLSVNPQIVVSTFFNPSTSSKIIFTFPFELFTKRIPLLIRDWRSSLFSSVSNPSTLGKENSTIDSFSIIGAVSVSLYP